MKTKVYQKMEELLLLALVHNIKRDKVHYSLQLTGHVNWLELQRENHTSVYVPMKPDDNYCSRNDVVYWYKSSMAGLKEIEKYMMGKG